MMNSDFVLSMSGARPQKYLLMLCMEKRRVVWYESEAGMANWFSHKIRHLDPRRVCLSPSNGYPCYRQRRAGVRSTGLFADEPRMPVGVFKHSTGEEAIPGLMERAVPLGWGSE